MPFGLTLTGVIFALAVAALYTPAPDMMARAVTLWAVYALAYALALWRPTWTQTSLRYAGPVLVAAILGTVATARMRGEVGRPYLGSYDPNVLATMLVLLLPWGRGATWYMLGATALVLTGSRGALLSLGAAFVGLIAYSLYREGKLTRGHLVGGALALALVGLGLALWRPHSVAIRLAIWATAARDFWTAPAFGLGLGAFRWHEHWHAHNLLLHVAAEQGLVGLVAWAVFLVEVGRAILNKPGTPARLALAAFLLHHLVDVQVWMLGPGLLAAINLGLLGVHHRDTEDTER